MDLLTNDYKLGRLGALHVNSQYLEKLAESNREEEIMHILVQDNAKENGWLVVFFPCRTTPNLCDIVFDDRKILMSTDL